MISAAQWKAYNDAVEAIRSRASSSVEREVLEWCAAHEGASVKDAREAAKAILSRSVKTYDQDAAVLAAEWYDAQGRSVGVKLDRAVTAVTYTNHDVDKLVHYQVEKYKNGDVGGFAAMCGEYAANDAMKSVNKTVLKNAKRDKAKGVMFARVTSGLNTCAFCLMLASRGAVYQTRKSAGEFDHWHRHCTCKVVPSFSGDKYEVLVEGHDPKKIESRLKEVERLTGAKPKTPEFTREVALRDPNWLLGGEARIAYEKPREGLLDHERIAVDALHDGGFSFTVLNEDENAAANIDLLSNSGQLWEMKDVGDGKHSIEDQLKSARSKWRRLGIDDPVRVVITGTKMTRGDEDAIAEIRRRSHYYDEALFIKRDGCFVRITK